MKSTEFVRERIVGGFANIDFHDDVEIFELRFDSYIKANAHEIILNTFKDNRLHIKYENVETMVNGKKLNGNIVVNILYDEDADFEYFTMEQCVCDGTMMFLDELANKVFTKLLHIQTVNNKKVKNGFNEDPFSYDINYTVGNFVIFDEYGDFGTEEKPWLKSRFTVMLPIKFDVVKRV